MISPSYERRNHLTWTQPRTKKLQHSEDEDGDHKPIHTGLRQCVEGSAVLTFPLPPAPGTRLSSEARRSHLPRTLLLVSIGGYGDDGPLGVWASELTLLLPRGACEGSPPCSESTRWVKPPLVPNGEATEKAFQLEGHSCTRVEERWFLFGGMNADYEITNTFACIQLLANTSVGGFHDVGIASDAAYRLHVDILNPDLENTGKVCPPPRYRHAAAATGSGDNAALWVFGGEGVGGDVLGDLYRYCCVQGIWYEVATTTTSRSPRPRLLATLACVSVACDDNREHERGESSGIEQPVLVLLGGAATRPPSAQFETIQGEEVLWLGRMVVNTASTAGCSNNNTNDNHTTLVHWEPVPCIHWGTDHSHSSNAEEKERDVYLERNGHVALATYDVNNPTDVTETLAVTAHRNQQRTFNCMLVFGGKGNWCAASGDDDAILLHRFVYSSTRAQWSVSARRYYHTPHHHHHPATYPAEGKDVPTRLVQPHASIHWCYMPAAVLLESTTSDERPSHLVHDEKEDSRTGGADWLPYTGFLLLGGDRRHPPADAELCPTFDGGDDANEKNSDTTDEDCESASSTCTMSVHLGWVR